MNPSAPATADLVTQPQPAPDRSYPRDYLFTVAYVLDLVLRLIAHGEHLAATLDQHAATPGFPLFARMFGSSDPAVILTCIRRGIMRANALHALLSRYAARGIQVPVPLPRFATPRSAPAAPTAPAIPAARPRKWWHDCDLAYLPTQQEIDEEVRCRTVGRLLMQIALDLAINPFGADALWDALRFPVCVYGGNFNTLTAQMVERLGELAHSPLCDALLPEPSPPDAAPPARTQCAATPPSLGSMQPDAEPTMHWPATPMLTQEGTAARPP